MASRRSGYAPLNVVVDPADDTGSSVLAKKYDLDEAAVGVLGGHEARAARWVARLRADRATWTALAACGAYSACSISMVLANKTLVTTFSFNHPLVLMLVQNLITLLLVVLTRVCFPRFAKFSGDDDLAALIGVKLPMKGQTAAPSSHPRGWRRRLGLLRIDAGKARAWAPVTALFVAMLCTSFEALHHISVPTVNVFKNVTNVLIAAGDWWWFGTTLRPKGAAALGLMVLGGVLTYFSDLEGTPAGYAWMGANVCVSAGYALALRHAVHGGVKLSRMEMVYYNSALSALPVLGLAWYTGELATVLGDGGAGLESLLPDGALPQFFAVLVFSGAVGFLLLLSALHCVECTSSTTYAVVGALNKVPLTVLGALLFRAHLTWKASSFIAASLAGGVLYAQAKNERRLADARARARRADDATGGFNVDAPTPDGPSPRGPHALGPPGPPGGVQGPPGERVTFGAAMVALGVIGEVQAPEEQEAEEAADADVADVAVEGDESALLSEMRDENRDV